MQKLAIPDSYMWSRWQADRGMYFNGHLFVTPEGNVAVDPVGLEPSDAEHVAALGGIAWIAVTNRDHLREAPALRERFGARIAASQREAPLLGVAIDRALEDGEELFPGASVVLLDDQKTPGEFALHLRKHTAVLVGDALIGAPAGALSLLADEKYGDAQRAVLGLRRLLALQPEALLAGDGASLWHGATRAIGAALFARGGIRVNRINLDELRYENFASPDGKYRSSDAEVGFWIGARHLGYQVVKLPPGARFCPVHAEFSEEELFIVFAGEPSIRTPRETLRCRPGDLIAFPAGPDHAHQVINESGTEATLLLLGQELPQNVVYYPESDKLLATTPDVRWMVRNSPQLDYFDGE
jgi:uncharacterized cupin superfamily protein